MNINNPFGNDISQLSKMAEKLLKESEELFNSKINEVSDDKMKLFLNNSLSLAKKGELDPMMFINNAKKYVEDANGNNCK